MNPIFLTGTHLQNFLTDGERPNPRSVQQSNDTKVRLRDWKIHRFFLYRHILKHKDILNEISAIIVGMPI